MYVCVTSLTLSTLMSTPNILEMKYYVTDNTTLCINSDITGLEVIKNFHVNANETLGSTSTSGGIFNSLCII